MDNGLDMYVGHGNHTIQGVEICKGRPIFYNLGNFARLVFVGMCILEAFFFASRRRGEADVRAPLPCEPFSCSCQPPTC